MILTEYLAGVGVEVEWLARHDCRATDRTPVVVSEEVLPFGPSRLQSLGGDGDASQSLANLGPLCAVGLLEANRLHTGTWCAADIAVCDESPARGATSEGFIVARHLESSVLPEWVFLLPSWLVIGLVVGAVASVVVAGVFVVGGRIFPDQPVSRGPRVDGAVRRRLEIREYLTSIGEQFVEDRSVYDETVAFYLPERRVAITFDAQAFFRLERTGVFPILCEHEMPGNQLGRRLPFDVPDIEPELADVDDPISEAFDRLGLPSDATSDAVRDAYRSQVKEAHPDHGGDRERFRRLREAYTMAWEHADE